MKHLKRFESNSEHTIKDILSILNDIVDDYGLNVTIFDAKFEMFYLEDLVNKGSIERFNLDLDISDKSPKFFKLVFRFPTEKDYFELNDFVSEMRPIIGRLEDLNFSLYNFFVGSELKIYSSENKIKWVPDSNAVSQWISSGKKWVAESVHFEFVSN